MTDALSPRNGLDLAPIDRLGDSMPILRSRVASTTESC